MNKKNTEWKGIVGKSFSTESFDAYCRQLQWKSWLPSLLVIHNTSIPSLKQRPQGFTGQHMRNFEVYYRDTQKWKAGPHLFVDDKQIWIFTPLTTSGTHSPSWNNISIGIEMLGDYEKEAFLSGRGLLVRNNTIAAIISMVAVLNLNPSTSIKLHKEDPLTTHPCPGKNVNKLSFIEDIQRGLNGKYTLTKTK